MRLWGKLKKTKKSRIGIFLTAIRQDNRIGPWNHFTHFKAIFMWNSIIRSDWGWLFFLCFRLNIHWTNQWISYLESMNGFSTKKYSPYSNKSIYWCTYLLSHSLSWEFIQYIKCYLATIGCATREEKPRTRNNILRPLSSFLSDKS